MNERGQAPSNTLEGPCCWAMLIACDPGENGRRTRALETQVEPGLWAQWCVTVPPTVNKDQIDPIRLSSLRVLGESRGEDKATKGP